MTTIAGEGDIPNSDRARGHMHTIATSSNRHATDAPTGTPAAARTVQDMRTSWADICSWRDYDGAEYYLRAIATAGAPPAGLDITALGAVARGVWASTTTDMTALTRALLDDDPWLARGLMTNLTAPPRLYRMVITHPGVAVKTFTGNAWAVLDLRWDLTPDSYTNTAAALIETVMTDDGSRAELFFDYRHRSVRRAVARHPKAPQQVLVDMARTDHDDKVLELIAGRQDLSAPVWKALAQRRPLRDVVITALLNPTAPEHALKLWSSSQHCEPDLRKDIDERLTQSH